MTDDCASAYLQGFKSMCCDGEGHLSWRAIAANGMKVSFAPLKAPTPGHAEKCQGVCCRPLFYVNSTRQPVDQRRPIAHGESSVFYPHHLTPGRGGGNPGALLCSRWVVLPGAKVKGDQALLLGANFLYDCVYVASINAGQYTVWTVRLAHPEDERGMAAEEAESFLPLPRTLLRVAAKAWPAATAPVLPKGAEARAAALRLFGPAEGRAEYHLAGFPDVKVPLDTRLILERVVNTSRALSKPAGKKRQRDDDEVAEEEVKEEEEDEEEIPRPRAAPERKKARSPPVLAVPNPVVLHREHLQPQLAALQVAFPTLVQCYGETPLHGEALLRPPPEFRRAFSDVGNIPAGEAHGIAILGPPGQWLRSKLCDFPLVSSTVGQLDARVPASLMVPTRRELICDALIVGQKPGQLVHLGLRELVGRSGVDATPATTGALLRRFLASPEAETSGSLADISCLVVATGGAASIRAALRRLWPRYLGIGAPELTVDAVIESGDPMLAAVWLIACSRYWSPPQGVAARYPSQRPLLMADELSDRALWVALDLNGLGTCLPVNTAVPAPVVSPLRPTPPRFTFEGFFTAQNEQQSATYATNAVAALSPPFAVKY